MLNPTLKLIFENVLVYRFESCPDYKINREGVQEVQA